MRTLGILAVLLLTASPAVAQTAGMSPTFTRTGVHGSDSAERDEGSTSSGGGESESRHAWYVAPTFGATYINHGFTPVYGVRAAFRINKKFGFGVAANGFDFDDGNAENHLEGGYGGVLMEYVILKTEAVQLVSGSTVGGGVYCPYDSAEKGCGNRYGFFASEPTLNVEIKATSYMRVAAGAGYRFTLAHEREGITGNELGGFVSRVALQFGEF